MIAVLTALSLTSTPPCVPVAQANTLWKSQETRWLFVGELHGTNEIPDAFVNLVCLASIARGPVTVALEYPVEMQPILNEWLTSDGGEKATRALLAAPFWHRSFQDGRTSTASLRMLERLRVLHATGKVLSLRALDVPYDGSDQRDRNVAMAAALTDIAANTPSLVMILVGNVHAMRTEITFGSNKVRPAALLLPQSKRISVDVVGAGGTAWLCERNECSAQSLGQRQTTQSSITWDSAPGRKFDVTYSLGIPTSAAAPAVAGISKTGLPTDAKASPEAEKSRHK